MNTSIEIKLDHSERRPGAQAWCASSDGHTTYARTREEALKRHKSTLEAYQMIASSLKRCAEHTACPEH